LLAVIGCDGGTRGSGIDAGFSTLTGSLALAPANEGSRALAANGVGGAAVVVQVRERPEIQAVVDPVTLTFTLDNVPAGDVTIDFLSTEAASIALRGLPEDVELHMVEVRLEGGVAKPAGFAVLPREGNPAEVVLSQRKGRAPLGVTFMIADSSLEPADQVLWAFGDGGRSGRASTSHVFAAPGIYVVEATIRGGAQTHRALTLVEVFHPNEDALQVTAAAEPTRGRAPLSVLFTATPDNHDGRVSYEWNFGDGSPFGVGQQSRHAFTLDGIYLVQVTASDEAGNEARDVLQVTVDSGVIQVPLSVTASVDQSVGTAPHTVRLLATIRGSGPVTIEWDFDDGTAPSTEPNPQHTYAVPGVYFPSVTVTEVAEPGEQASANVMVEVVAAGVPPP
jgi:PKD repeat protein